MGNVFQATDSRLGRHFALKFLPEAFTCDAERVSRWFPNTFELAVVSLQERIVGGARRALSVLLAAVVFVLLIASVNIAHLLLARASAREKEIAIRASLGAARVRLLRQFLAEGIVLSLMGGAAGLLLAKAGVMLIINLAPHAMPRLTETSIDGPVLAFCLGTSLVSLFQCFLQNDSILGNLSVGVDRKHLGDRSGCARQRVRER